MKLSKNPIMTPEEALQFHKNTLIVDSQQPGATSGLLFNTKMKQALKNFIDEGKTRREIRILLQAMATKEIQNSPEAANEYMDIWEEAGVDVASATYAATEPPETAFETSLTSIAQARSIIDALSGRLRLVLKASDIEKIYQDRARGVIFDFQDTTPFGTDLDRVNLFYNLGLRVVQLTYNLRNLVGDGCTERYKTGLTYFGHEMVGKLNEMNMLIDVSHSSEQVGWDTLEASNSPIVVTHSTSNSITYHDRGKSDDLIKAIAERGGFFGVAAIGGFIHDKTGATLDHFVDHVIHLINIMGIDHVGIGCDKCGPGPGTESNIEFPESLGPFDTSYLYKKDPNPKSTRGSFSWAGFRQEHRLSDQHRIQNFDRFTDWPNITLKLIERGFNEEQLKKILGLNYLRVFKEVVG